MKRIIPLVTIIVLLLSCFNKPAAASHAGYTDISGHWAQEVIERWSERNIVTGYNGLFRPDDPITHGELAAILNRLLKYPSSTRNIYNDLTPDMWYYDDILALSYEGAFAASMRIEDQKIIACGDVPITREYAIYMIALAFGIREEASPHTFTDVSVFSNARSDISIMVAKGFISGFPDGTFKPKEPLTRAQVLKILDNMIDIIIDTPTIFEYTNGFSGKNILVNCDGVCLSSLTLKNLYLSPTIEAGNIELRNCAITDFYLFGKDDSVYTQTQLISESGNTVENFRVKHLKDYIQSPVVYAKPLKELNFSGGDGTESNPYIISNEEQLLLLHEFTDPYYSSTYTYTYFKLSNNIKLTKPWTPLNKFEYGRFGENSYNVMLDGSGHTISGINITATEWGYGNISIGLFSTIQGGTVKNLTVEGTITNEGNGVLREALYAGGICGSLESGSIENCVSKVNINVRTTSKAYVGGIAGFTSTATTISDSSCSGTISAQTEPSESTSLIPFVGGIVGRGNGIIRKSSSSGSITAIGGYYSCAGAIVGAITNGAVEQSYSTGKVLAKGALMQNNAGGIAGQAQSDARISSCFSSSDIMTEGEPGYFNAGGGVAGAIYESSQIINCYATGNVSSTTNGGFCSLGGVVGRLRADVKNCYSTSTVSSNSYGKIYNDYVLVGSGGIDEGNIISCADLINNSRGYPILYSGPVNESIKTLSKEAVISQKTYSDAGWDFNSVWSMPPSGYTLPILRGVNESIQRNQAFPAHLK